MIGMRDELVNNLVKLSSVNDQISGVEEHSNREHQKPTEMMTPKFNKMLKIKSAILSGSS